MKQIKKMKSLNGEMFPYNIIQNNSHFNFVNEVNLSGIIIHKGSELIYANQIPYFIITINNKKSKKSLCENVFKIMGKGFIAEFMKRFSKINSKCWISGVMRNSKVGEKIILVNDFWVEKNFVRIGIKASELGDEIKKVSIDLEVDNF